MNYTATVQLLTYWAAHRQSIGLIAWQAAPSKCNLLQIAMLCRSLQSIEFDGLRADGSLKMQSIAVESKVWMELQDIACD